MITVYSKERCVQCTATERWLTTRGIEFVKDDATDMQNLLAIHELGYTQAPVVVVSTPAGDRHWSGFDPERLEWYVLGLGSEKAWSR